MSDKKKTLATSHELPTLSSALERWLEREISTRVDVSGVGDSAAWWSDFDNCGQLEMAARVRRGFRLTQILAASERDFQDGLKQRDINLAGAYQLIDCYKLFVAFPRLEQLDRAAALGFSRIRELKPHLGIDGIRQLVEGKEVDTLGYDQAVGMTKREIITWRKQRDKLALDQAAGPERTREADAAAAAMRHEPRDLTVARSELLANVTRAREELERGRRIAAALLPHENDAWEAERLELAHQTRKMLRAVDEEVAALDTLLGERFGAASVAPMTGEYQTLDPALVRAADDMAASQANASLLERAKHRARVMKWRGAPPKDVDAVITHAQKNDG